MIARLMHLRSEELVNNAVVAATTDRSDLLHTLNNAVALL